MITIAIVWVVGLAVMVLSLARSVRTVHRAFYCSFLGTDVQARFLEALPEGRPIDVTACSAFTPPTAIACDRRCLGLPGLARRATSQARG
jgi:hypothetical protein